MPAPYSAGSIFLQVVPSFRGVPEQIAREAREWPDQIGKDFDKGMEKVARESGKKAGKELGKELVKGADEAGKTAGDNYSGRFRESLRKGIASAQRELNTTPLQLVLRDEGLRKTLDKVRADFKSLDQQVKLGMDASGSLMELRRILKVLDDVKDRAQNVEVRSNVASIHRDLSGVEKHIAALSATDIEPKLKIDRELSAFERRLKAGIKSALSDIPPLDIDDAAANAKVEALRERLQSLDRDVDLGVDSGDLFTELAAIQAALHEVADTADSMKLRVDGASAFKTIATTRAELESLSRMTIEPELKLERNLGAFERGIKGAIDNALKDLGAQPVGVDSNAGQRAAADLRRELLTLGDRKIGVDISAETARAQLERIRDDLEQLQREHWSVDIDADVAAATAAISGFLAALEAVDGRHVDVDVDVKDAASAINSLDAVGDAARRTGRNGDDGANSFRAFNIRILGVAALGPLVVPALAAIGGGIAALLPIAAAAGAAVGVLVLGLMGVGDAVKAMGAARTAGPKDAADYEKGVRTASEGIANARRGVADAERGVADARADAARANVAAGRQVEDALRGVEDAERNLRDAQRDAKQAQEDLTRARVEAAEELEDLQLQVRGGALDERQAVIDLREAEKELRDARAEGVGGDELESYIIAMERAKLRVDSTRESNGDLAAESARWAQTGVEGSDRVVAAQERVQSANERIAEAERGVADAQRGVADARAQAAQTALDGQRQIADAQRSVGDAQRALTEATTSYTEALGKTSSAQDKLNESLNKLGPEGRKFATYIDSLRPKFQYLRSLAQEGLLPGLTDWIGSIVAYHGPLLESTVSRMGTAIGGMFSQFATSLRGEEFTAFFQMIERSGPAFVGIMGNVLVNLGQGIASLTTAMEPLALLFGGWLVDATERFNDWANSLQGSTGLASFFSYMEQIIPKVAQFIYNLADALIQIGIAIAPFAEGLLDILSDFLAFIAELDPSILGPITVGLVGFVLALQAIFGMTALFKSVETATHLMNTAFGSLTLGMLGWIAVIGIAVFALIGLYRESEEFRDAIDAIWSALGPVIDILGGAFMTILGTVTGIVETFSTEIGLLVVALVGIKVVSMLGGLLAAFGRSVQTTATTQVATMTSRVGLMTTAIGVAGLNAQAASARIASAYTAAMRAIVIQSGGAMGAMNGVVARMAGIGAAAAATAGVAASGLARAGGSIVSFLGGPWMAGILGAIALIGMYASEVNKVSEAERKMGEELAKGGAQAAEVWRKLDAERAKYSDNWFGDLSYNLDAQFGLAMDDEDAVQEMNTYFASLTPVAEAQAKVDQWTNTLAYRTETLGKNHKDTAIAAERQAIWTKILEDRQRDLDNAVEGVNTALLDQQNRLLSMTEADMAFAQSTEQLAQAHKRVSEALKENGADSDEYRNALGALESQQLSTAQAAARVAESRYSDATEGERQQRANAALLANLIAQEEQYGKLPPRLDELKNGLLNSVPAAYLAVAQMDALKLSVEGIPNDKTIVISGNTPQEQLDRLRALGFEVTQLPDGSFEVTANTDAAAALLDEFINTEREITIGANVLWGGQAKQNFNQKNDGRTYFGQVPEFAGGGAVFGPGSWTSDSIPAYLSNGEYVIRAASVAKYGLELFDALNRGTAPGFARGGKVKNGRAAFAEGGLAVNWGGSMSVTGGDVSPLAAPWFQAVSEINRAAAMGVGAMSQTLARLAAMANASFSGTAAMMLARWQQLSRDVVMQTLFMGQGVVGQLNFAQANAMTVWNSLSRMLTMITDLMVSGQIRRFTAMKDSIVLQANLMMLGIKAQMDRLPGIVAGPTNTVIEKVINGGLIGAFNNIAGQLGTGAKPLTTTPSVKLAAGGRVPGYSPNDKADNIPAWLTAGEFVQPVDVVRHYGVDFMEKLRKKELPRREYAVGGYVAMSNTIKKQFPWARITSGFRQGDPGYHGKGMAIDIGGAAAYPNPVAITQLLEINRWIASNFSNITELIHTQPGAINLLGGRPYNYNSGTQAQHRNHVHWAQAAGLIPGGGAFPGMGGEAGLFDPAGAINKAVNDALTGFGTSPMHGVMAEVPKKLAGMAIDRMNKMIETAVFSMGDSAIAGAAPANVSGVVALTKQMAAARGWTGNEWDALYALGMRESGFRPTAQNPTSTAYGIWQFLNGTWGSTGIAKTSDPRLQNEAGFRYIASRYGTPSRALAFHKANNWYGEGGEVKANQADSNGMIVPDLHDTGGWLMPGLNVLMNRTGRPEPTINPQTLDALLTIADRGTAGAPLIGEYVQTLASGSPKEAVDEVMHQLAVLEAGGRYSG